MPTLDDTKKDLRQPIVGINCKELLNSRFLGKLRSLNRNIATIQIIIRLLFQNK